MHGISISRITFQRCCSCYCRQRLHSFRNWNRVPIHNPTMEQITIEGVNHEHYFRRNKFEIGLIDIKWNSTHRRCFIESGKNSLEKCDFLVSYYKTNYISGRHFSFSSTCFSTLKPATKIEVSIQALKEKEKKRQEAIKVAEFSEIEKKPAVVKKSLKQRIMDEISHYYHGFRLLCVDINVSRKLIWRLLRGHTLSRRETRLLRRVVGDIFRMIPFIVFIVVPFMELTLPLFIKLFPGMLPSTFQTAKDKETKFKQELSVKLSMAKFLQKTLIDIPLKGKGHKSKSAKQFSEFFQNIRSGGRIATTEEIMKFSKVFKDEITLDSLPRAQLMALCRVLEMQPIGMTNFLRFQLKMKLRFLAADDKMIQEEGIDSLNEHELLMACKARGMRSFGLTQEQQKAQLRQWIDLSMNEKVPPSLLLMSRAFMLPETVTMAQQLAITISALPETVAIKTKAAISEREGKLDAKTQIRVIKDEEKKITEERTEKKLVKQKEKLLRKDSAIDLSRLGPNFEAPQIECIPVLEDDLLVCRPKFDRDIDGVTSRDVKTLTRALDVIGKEKHKLILEKGEVNRLKGELAEYKEVVADLKDLQQRKVILKESRAAKNLFKVVNKMIKKLEIRVDKLEQRGKTIKMDSKKKVAEGSAEHAELLRIDELTDAIRKIQKVPDSSRLQRITQVLEGVDVDHDGVIRLDSVLKVIELIGHGNLKLSKTQMVEVVELIKKEEEIEKAHIKAREEKARFDAKLAQLAAAANTVSKPTIAATIQNKGMNKPQTIVTKSTNKKGS